ncbi:MAG: hypothetical protein IH874_05930 [Candidatus Dadabacteria bacterium]|nr:hypothetical protein [Candidatus Dadabacteria bacterium]
MKQIIFLAAILIIVGIVYKVAFEGKVKEAQEETTKVGKALIGAPAKVREVIKRDNTGRSESEWSDLYTTTGVVVSISGSQIVVDEDGTERSYRVNRPSLLKDVEQGDTISFKLSGYDIIDISVQ